MGYKAATVRTPDSDTLHYAEPLKPMAIYLILELEEIGELAASLTPIYFLLGLYCFTGEDSNCVFLGKGKVTPLRA